MTLTLKIILSVFALITYLGIGAIVDLALSTRYMITRFEKVLCFIALWLFLVSLMFLPFVFIWHLY